MEESDDERRERSEQLAAHKRYNMKALGRLVDSNRLTGIARPESLDQTSPRRVTRGEPDDAGPEAHAVAEPAAPAPVSAPSGDVGESPLPQRTRTHVGTHQDGTPTDAGTVQTPSVDDGVDRSEIGGAVTRTGLSGRLDDPSMPDRVKVAPGASPLARQMLDDEIAPGGRISDPRDVAGIVLDLAADVPASVAVSVVRIDEEVEVVGGTVDPTVDPDVFSAAFSELFRGLRPTAEILEMGPLGDIRDIVVAGEHMDLILRPLGDRYFLMVLEDRHDRRADLEATRGRMAMIAPAVTAVLSQQDGET